MPASREKIQQQFVGKKIAILGFGLEGRSTLEFLLDLGVGSADIEIRDAREIPEKLAVATRTGEKYLEDLEGFDWIFKAPGVSVFLPELAGVQEKLTSQAQVFFDFYAGKVVTITGTKGKSTTSTLLAQVLEAAGLRVKLVGNIGKPVLSEIGFEDEFDWVVYETSSYVLENLKKKNEIALILNIFPDHLDRHHGFENYKNAKLKNFLGAKEKFVNQEVVLKFPEIRDFAQDFVTFGHGGDFHFHAGSFLKGAEKLFDFVPEAPSLQGQHNLLNLLAIVGVCEKIGIDWEIVEKTFQNFVGLPHRLQKVGVFRGVEFWDDANSTTPESTVAALRALGGQVETIFLGGQDRGYDFAELVAVVEESGIKNVVLFPDTTQKLRGLLGENFNFLETSSMEEAVEWAFAVTSVEKICLLSTAAPSYSLRKNADEKGKLFVAAVEKFGQ